MTMFNNRTGDCSQCLKENVLIAKKLPSGPLCIKCNQKRLAAKKEKKEPIGLNGQMGVFLKIWEERPHVSEVNGEPLGNIMKPIFFSHLLPKGSYPHYCLNTDNIMLKTQDQHVAWHSESRADLVKKDPGWQKVIDKYEKLKEKYLEEFGS